MRWLVLLVAACDGDGCNGGPNTPASKFCQDAIENAKGDAAMSPEAICKGCCVQEVPYEGRIENGKCVCR